MTQKKLMQFNFSFSAKKTMLNALNIPIKPETDVAPDNSLSDIGKLKISIESNQLF